MRDSGLEIVLKVAELDGWSLFGCFAILFGLANMSQLKTVKARGMNILHACHTTVQQQSCP